MENDKAPVSLKLSDRQPETERETAAMLSASQLDALSLLRGSAEDLKDLEDLGCVMALGDGSIERTGWGSTVLIEAGSLGLEDRDDLPTLEDEFGCDPWDSENFGRHAASTGDAEPDNSDRIVRGRRW